MSSPSRNQLMIASWLLAIGIVAASLLVADRVTAGVTDYEDQARAALDEFASTAKPGELRIVILGDSLGRNALGHGEEIETALAAAGIEATVVNLSAPAMTLKVIDPLFEDILAVEPGVLVIQPELTAHTELLLDRSLRMRVRNWLRPQRLFDYFANFCPGRSDELLNTRRIDVPKRFGPGPTDLDLAFDLADAMAELGGHVLIVEVPVSASLTEATGPSRDEFRAEVSAELTARPNVSAAPAIDIAGLGHYCDYSHLNAKGRQKFLAQFLPDFTEYVDGLD